MGCLRTGELFVVLVPWFPPLPVSLSARELSGVRVRLGAWVWDGTNRSPSHRCTNQPINQSVSLMLVMLSVVGSDEVNASPILLDSGQDSL